MCGLNKEEKSAALTLNGEELPWVESAQHLGHVLHESGGMDKDIRAKRAAFIANSTECRESFSFASPCEILKAVKVYVGSHHGLRCSPSMEVRVMAGIVCRDVRTTTGRNVWLLERETGVDPFLTKSWQIKAVLTGKLASIPDMDMWRIMYLSKLLEARGQAYYEGEEYQYLTELVDSLCIS